MYLVALFVKCILYCTSIPNNLKAFTHKYSRIKHLVSNVIVICIILNQRLVNYFR